MGQFYQVVRLTGDKTATVRMLVDNRLTYSLVSEALAKAIGIKIHSRPFTTTLTNGRRMKANAGIVSFSILAREAPGTVLVGNIEVPILGMQIVATLGLTVDRHWRRLRKSRAFLLRTYAA
jgi:predicted aspartyl protease